jgi:sugar-phosphatase
MTDSADIIFPAAGVLFDCDGVLVDSDASVLSAWTRWAVLYDQDPEAVELVVHGRRAADTVDALISPDRRAVALTDINAFEVEDAVTVTPIPGAAGLLGRIPHDRWAIVTSGNRVLAAARLIAAGIPEAAVIITADDVTNGKPHPEGYRAAAQRIGLDPHETVVFEDAPSGVAAARAAGVGAVIGVGERALQTDADVVIKDLNGISWTDNGLAIAQLALLRATGQPGT